MNGMAEVVAGHVMVAAYFDGVGIATVTCQCGHESTGPEVEVHEYNDDARIHAVHQAAMLSAAGFGDVREAKAQALEEAADAAEGMHDPAAPDCQEWADWLRARAAAVRGEG